MSQYRKQREDVNYTWPISTQRQKRKMPQNQMNSANHVVSVFFRERSMRACHGCLQENFILHFIFIVLSFLLMLQCVVFYVSLEVINFPLVKIKVDMFVVYSLNSYSHLKQKINQYLKKKNRVMCILQTQSVTSFFLYFYCLHQLESAN